MLAPALTVLGFGMGTCFGTLFDVALGNIAADEAGSASGSLSAVQQLASAIGAAAMTTVYFNVLTTAGQAHAVVVSLIVAGAVTLLCCGLVWLLPRDAADHDGARDEREGAGRRAASAARKRTRCRPPERR